MDRAARESLAHKILALANRGENEVIVVVVDDGLTRFTHNAIHQNVAHAEATLRLRTVIDGRTGVASANAFDDAALAELAARAAAMAQLSAPVLV